MKLCIDDEDHRPQYLTNRFFISFMITQTKRKATLQILEFHKKKQLTYSTKISDGYFIVKVMVIQKAAEQLQRGDIKLKYVIQGMLRNHGQGVIMIRDAVKFWRYQSVIGIPVVWRLNRQNVNSKGHGFIVWNSQQLYQLHTNSQQQAIKEHIIKQQQKSKQLKKQLNEKDQISKKEQSALQQISKQLPNNNIKRLNSVAVQSEQEVNQPTNLVQPASLSLSTVTLTQTGLNQSSKHSHQQEKNTILDLRFVFDFFQQQDQRIKKQAQQQGQIQPVAVVQQLAVVQMDQDDDEQDFMNYFFNRQKQPTQSALKRLQMYKRLLSQQQSDKQQTNNTIPLIQAKQKQQIKLSVKQVKEKQKQDKHSFQITFQDIYHGLTTRSGVNWYTKALICCLGPLNQKDIAYAILSDNKGYYIINAVFINYSHLKAELNQNKLYKLGNGLIRVMGEHLQRNVSHCQLQFDCKKATIECLHSNQHINYRSQNYTQLNKLYHMDDGMRVNTFAVIKSIRNTEGKNGTMSHYEIVDPVIKHNIAFTQFESNLTEQDLTTLVNTPITIYNAWTSSFRGRKNIVSRGKTIVKYNWLPILHEADLIWKWLLDQNSMLQNIELNLVGYEECQTLDQIDSVAEGRVSVRNVTIIDINDKFTYMACVKCFKKIQDGRCRTCGKRNIKEIVERLLIRGNIGDNTNVISVLWSNSFGQTIVKDGIGAFKQKWEVKKVTVWLQRGSKQGYTIIKVKQNQVKTRIKQLLQYVQSHIL